MAETAMKREEKDTIMMIDDFFVLAGASQSSHLYTIVFTQNRLPCSIPPMLAPSIQPDRQLSIAAQLTLLL